MIETLERVIEDLRDVPRFNESDCDCCDAKYTPRGRLIESRDLDNLIFKYQEQIEKMRELIDSNGTWND